MNKITIELSDKQEQFLKEFALKHYDGSKDNVGTETPIHIVQTRRERVIDPEYDSADITKYYIPDNCDGGYDSAEELIKAFYEDDECPIPIVSFQDAYDAKRFIDVNGIEQVIVDEKDYLEAYGIDNYYKVCLEYYYQDVAYFFILDEAKKYMQYQKHNLDHPRTYTVGGGYANKGEYHHFWKLLFDLGNHLNEQKSEDVYIEPICDICHKPVSQCDRG